MSAIVYYITLPFIYLLSLLPFPILYALSDFMYFLLFHMLGYRRKVVAANLRNSFPAKTEKELDELCRAFYRHLCDIFLETFKTLTISRKSMLRHCSFDPASKDIFDKLAAQGKSAIMVLGHQGNWEWAGNTFSLLCAQQLYVIYHPLTNKYFNGLTYRMRTRFGTKLIAMKDTFREMVANKAELSVTAFIADQTPQPHNAYWTNFLSQDTPVFWGAEKISRKLDYPVVYIQVKKLKRGHYTILAETLVPAPSSTTDGEISELFTRRLEQDIIAQPETWLWSHRRWKHRRPVA